MQEAPHPFGTWESFYVIVGTSAAALTGLQFVVITLVKESWREPSSGEISAFATPTIFHFCAALLVSATLSAPWPELLGPRLIIGACGLAGIIYQALVLWRATHATRYKMVLEDWIWHVTLPAFAYLVMVAGGFTLDDHSAGPLFAIAGSALLLLFIGIHNAWDTTTYVASGRAAAEAQERNAVVSTALAPPVPPSSEPARADTGTNRP